MKATEFLPDAQRVLAERDEPAYRLKQVHGALAEEIPAAVPLS